LTTRTQVFVQEKRRDPRKLLVVFSVCKLWESVGPKKEIQTIGDRLGLLGAGVGYEGVKGGVGPSFGGKKC